MSIIDELARGFGHQGAGLIEYLGGSPQAAQDLGPVGAAVPNAFWLLGGIAQYGGEHALAALGAPVDPNTNYLLRLGRSGVDNANQIMSNLTGQEITDPQNFIDTLNREGALALLPTRLATQPAKAAATHLARTEAQQAAANVAKVIAPGIQAKTGAGMAAEFGAGALLADVIQETADTDITIDPEYNYQGAVKQLAQGLGVYPEIDKTALQQQIEATLSHPVLAPWKPGEHLSMQNLEHTIMNGMVKEVNPDSWDVIDTATVFGGALLTALGGTMAAKRLGKLRQDKIKGVAGSVFGDPAQLEKKAIKEAYDRLTRDRKINGASFKSNVREKGITHAMSDFFHMMNQQWLDNNHMILNDSHWATKQANIPWDEADHEQLTKLVDHMGNEGALSDTTKATLKSGRLPMTGQVLDMPPAHFVDMEAHLPPEVVGMYNQKLMIKSILHDIEEYNKGAIANNRKYANNPKKQMPIIREWGDPNVPGAIDGQDYYSVQLMQHIRNQADPPQVKQMMDHWKGMMDEFAEWQYNMGEISKERLKEWRARPYAPLRFPSDVEATDFMKRRGIFTDEGVIGVMPGEVELPSRLLAEYADRMVRGTLANQHVKKSLEMEFMARRKTIDGDPLVRRVYRTDKNFDEANSIRVNAYNGGEGMMINGKREFGEIWVQVNDPVRLRILQHMPMMHNKVVNFADSFRRVGQQMTTGIGNIAFAKPSALYEAFTSIITHPKGRNISTAGQMLSALSNGRFKWDTVDPFALANPITGTVRGIWSDILETGLRRFHTINELGDEAAGPLIRELLGDDVAKKFTRRADKTIAGNLSRLDPTVARLDTAAQARYTSAVRRGVTPNAVDSLFVDTYGLPTREKLYKIMQRSYLNASKHIKEHLGGGTAVMYGDNFKDVPDVLAEIAPAYARQLGDKGFATFMSLPGVHFLKSMLDNVHLSTRIEFIGANKGVSVRMGKWNGNEVPVIGHPGVIGYSPELHAMVGDARKLTGNITRRGGVPGSTLGQFAQAGLKTVEYANVAIQVAARVLEQFYKRPVHIMTALTAGAAAYQSYVMNYIVGNPERERVYFGEMGPGARSAGVPIFGENDEVIAFMEIPHELRLLTSPFLESQWAALGKTADFGDMEPAWKDMLAHFGQRFEQDILPRSTPLLYRSLGAFVSGDRTSEPIPLGNRMNPFPMKPDEVYDDGTWRTNVRLMAQEGFMGAAQMFITTLEALDAAIHRGDSSLDWQRAIDELQKGLTYNFRKDKTYTAPLLYSEAWHQKHGEGPPSNDQIVDNTITTFDDQYAEEYHNGLENINTWIQQLGMRHITPYTTAGQSGVSRPDSVRRTADGDLLGLGEMSETDMRFATNLKMLYEGSDVMRKVRDELTDLGNMKKNARKKWSDPVKQRNAINGIERFRKRVYITGVLELRRLEEQLRQMHPEFTTFRHLRNRPKTKWFDREGVGKEAQIPFLQH